MNGGWGMMKLLLHSWLRPDGICGGWGMEYIVGYGVWWGL